MSSTAGGKLLVRRWTAGERPDERIEEEQEQEEKAEGDDVEHGGQEAGRRFSRELGGSLCAPPQCPRELQFRLNNDCCTYCASHDFCRPNNSSSPTLRCHPNAECTNLVGQALAAAAASSRGSSNLELHSMFACQCRAGFRGDGQRECADVDECSDGRLNDCDARTTRCTNTPGSYKCKCRPGYRPLDGPPGASSRQAAALLSAGTPVVSAGESRALQKCQDVNECADARLNRCHPAARCINTPGSYKCVCRSGHLGNGLVCHKWLSSTVSVAAYLHRHQTSEPAASLNDTEPMYDSASYGGTSGPRDEARVRRPLNDDDDDDEEEEENEDAEDEEEEEKEEVGDSRRNAVDSLAPDGVYDDEPVVGRSGGPKQQRDSHEALYDAPVPRLSDSRWEPLRKEEAAAATLDEHGEEEAEAGEGEEEEEEDEEGDKEQKAAGGPEAERKAKQQVS